jgi:hypothetical protein
VLPEDAEKAKDIISKAAENIYEMVTNIDGAGGDGASA